MGCFVMWILLKLASPRGLKSDLHRSVDDTKKPVLGYQYLCSHTEEFFKEKELKCKKLKRKMAIGWTRMEFLSTLMN